MNNLLLAGGLGLLGTSVIASMFNDRALKHSSAAFHSDTRLFETAIGSSQDKRSVIDNLYVLDNKSNEANPYIYHSSMVRDKVDAQGYINHLRDMDLSTTATMFFSQVYIENRDISDVDDMTEFMREKDIITVINTAGKFMQKDFSLPESYYDEEITWPALALLEAALRNNQVIRFVQPIFATAMNLKLNIPGLELHPFVRSQQKLKECMEAMVENAYTNSLFLDLVFVSIPMVDIGYRSATHLSDLQKGALSGHPWYGDMLNLLPIDRPMLSDNGDVILTRDYPSQDGLITSISSDKGYEAALKSTSKAIAALQKLGIKVTIPIMSSHQFFTREIAGNILARAGWFFIPTIRLSNRGEDTYFDKWVVREGYGNARSVTPKIRVYNISICSFESSISPSRYRYVNTQEVFKNIFSEYESVIDYVSLDATCGLPILTSLYQYIPKGPARVIQENYITRDNIRDNATDGQVSVLFNYTSGARLSNSDGENGETINDICKYQSMQWQLWGIFPKARNSNALSHEDD